MPKLNLTAQNAFIAALNRWNDARPHANFTPVLALVDIPLAGMTAPLAGDHDKDTVTREAVEYFLECVTQVPTFDNSATILQIKKDVIFPFVIADNATNTPTADDITAIERRIIKPSLTVTERTLVFNTLTPANIIYADNQMRDALKVLLSTLQVRTPQHLHYDEVIKLLKALTTKAQSIQIQNLNAVWPMPINSINTRIQIPALPYATREAIYDSVIRQSLAGNCWNTPLSGYQINELNRQLSITPALAAGGSIEERATTIFNSLKAPICINVSPQCFIYYLTLCYCCGLLKFASKPLPLKIDEAYKNTPLARGIAHEYKRYRQTTQLGQYLPIAAALVLGVLGAIQTLVTDTKNSRLIAKSFGLTQACIGLAATFITAVGNTARNNAEKKLRVYVHDACSTLNNYATFFSEPILNNNEEAVLKRLGLTIPEATQNNPQA